MNSQKRREGKDLESPNAQRCVASTLDDGDVLHSELAMVSEGKKWIFDVWLINSGVTWHMTSRRELFNKYKPILGGSIYMGDDHAFKIFSISIIKIKMFDGTVHTIEEVRHVKVLKKNR